VSYGEKWVLEGRNKNGDVHILEKMFPRSNREDEEETRKMRRR
jgi:hypothetical protein